LKNKPGGCRICVVEVKGRRNLAPACCTDAAEGMEIKTNTMRVLNARRTVLELILSDHPADCLNLRQIGNCELTKPCTQNWEFVRFTSRANNRIIRRFLTLHHPRYGQMYHVPQMRDDV
jgi:predicted molibdopterin-dependent oxidoreductase YjgC